MVQEEKQRTAKEGEIDTPLVVKLPFAALCWVMDVLYDHKPIPVLGGGGREGECFRNSHIDFNIYTIMYTSNEFAGLKSAGEVIWNYRHPSK